MFNIFNVFKRNNDIVTMDETEYNDRVRLNTINDEIKSIRDEIDAYMDGIRNGNEKYDESRFMMWQMNLNLLRNEQEALIEKLA